MISQSVLKLLKSGYFLELINNDNLEFNGKFYKDVFKSISDEKILVVCIIGSQGSGKSTLLNYAFGTQSIIEEEKSTRGINFTLQRFPEDIKNESGFSSILIIDTEGLHKPGIIDEEFEKKILLFAMLSADIILINHKAEIS